MLDTTMTGQQDLNQESVSGTQGTQQFARWSQQLQRRVIRLLLQHDRPLFQQQFHLFTDQSGLPQIPLLLQYDRYIKLHLLSHDLLDDIMPRIRRQLSLNTTHLHQQEEAPTRGNIDWARSIERSWSHIPGLPPQVFDTRRRNRSTETPENMLTVAILLAFQQEIQHAMNDLFTDEELNQQEKQFFVDASERTERELAAAYARALRPQAQVSAIPALIQQVVQGLKPGPSPYRNLVHWWQRFSQMRIGRTAEEHTLALTPARSDEKMDAWLYELWIMLELIHFLRKETAIGSQNVLIASDLLQCTFTWQARRFRLTYNRQLDTTTGYEPTWEHGPASRPDYAIARETPLRITHQGELIWQEPPVILDAKYYLNGSDPTNTHGPIKKMLGDMTLLGAPAGALFFPLLPEPAQNNESTQITRTIQQQERHYQQAGDARRPIHLYHIAPSLPVPLLQQRLRAILDMAITQLPERPEPVCQGVFLDHDTINADQHLPQPRTILCPKPHIGPAIFDLVNADSDCLHNPRVCHVIDQPIIPPTIIRAQTVAQLNQRSTELRMSNSERLSAAEDTGDEERAERIRARILHGVGHAVEQYIHQVGHTKPIEDNFKNWIFGSYWESDARSLSQAARGALVSGEYVWQQYQQVALQDWAAPAIQYCRALEHELKRRLYDPCPGHYPPSRSGFTLGTVDFAYQQNNGAAKNIWNIFLSRARQSGSDEEDFQDNMHQVHMHGIKDKRNQLAHGAIVPRETAEVLRTIVIGTRNQPGVLSWIVEHLEPARA